MEIYSFDRGFPARIEAAAVEDFARHADKVFTRAPVQSLAVRSWEPVRTDRPSPLTATDLTPSRWTRDAPEGRPVPRSHSRALPSKHPVTNVMPSGVNASASTSAG